MRFGMVGWLITWRATSSKNRTKRTRFFAKILFLKMLFDAFLKISTRYCASNQPHSLHTNNKQRDKETMATTPIVVTNPDAVRYLIFQLYTEAILVLTLVLIVPLVVLDEWRLHRKNNRPLAKPPNSPKRS